MAEPSVPAPHAAYPVTLDVRGRRCLVVGAGAVAARKAAGLLACGAVVTVIAPEIGDAMGSLSPLHVERRAYAAGDAAGFRLVLTATGRPEVDGAVHAEAEAAGIWVNSADDAAHCTFALPSVHRDGPVSVAVSTSGASPALASWLGRQLGAQVDGAGALAAVLSAARDRVKAQGRSTEEIDWAALLDGPLPALLRQGRVDDAAALIDAALA